MLSRGTFIVIAGLIFMVILTSWYAASLTRIFPLPNSGVINMGVLTNAHVIQTTDRGALQYQGDMATATELSNGDVSFAGLSVLFYGATKAAPWHLKADTGSTLKRGKQVNLKGHVVASRVAYGTAPALVIKTYAASIYPELQQIKGSGLITFSQPGSINTMHGTGFIADLKGKWIKLLSQVKGIYAPR